jgi:hypothetical protein
MNPCQDPLIPQSTFRSMEIIYKLYLRKLSTLAELKSREFLF